MKLFAWLCMAWRPPVSSTFTHISLSDQPRRSPNSSAPNSGSSGFSNAATSTSSGESPGRSSAVCDRFGDELLASVDAAAEVLDESRDQRVTEHTRRAHERRRKEPKDFLHERC